MAVQSDKDKENIKQGEEQNEAIKGPVQKPETIESADTDKDTKGQEQEGSIKNSK